MPDGPQKNRTLIEELLRRVAALEAMLVRTPERSPEPRQPRNPRLARTVQGPEDAYPARADNPNTYRIVFVDATFTEAVGNQTVSATNRQDPDSASAFAHAQVEDGPAYIAENTLIWVFWDNGRWWFYRFCSDRCTCLLKGAMATSDTTKTVDNVAPICGASPVANSSEELTVYNTHAWEGDDNALGRIEWNRTTGHWEFYQVTCPA